MPDKEIAIRITELGFAGFISAVGGVAHYLYKVSQGMPFRFTMFCINVVLAGFVGTFVGSVMDPSMQYRDAVIAISGFSSLHILGFFENGGWRYVANIVLRAFKLPELTPSDVGESKSPTK